MKVDIDKFIASLCKNKIDYGLRAVINEALDEQSLRFDGNDLVEIKHFKLEEGKWYVFTHASLHYDTMNGEVTFEKNKPYKAIGESTLLGDGGEYCFRWQEHILKNLRPATDEEIIANNLSTIGSANVDPNIQEVINDHFDEMLDDDPKPKFKIGDNIVNKGTSMFPRIVIDILENHYTLRRTYDCYTEKLYFADQDQWELIELVEPQSNAINILPDGIDIDSMMPNFEDRDWVVGFHTKISDVAKEFYRKGLEDMLQAIRKKG